MKLFHLTLALGVALSFSTMPNAHAENKQPGSSGSPSPAGEIDRGKQPEAGPLPAVHFPEALTETLPNGLRVYILQSDRQPTVTYRLLIKSGDIFDGPKPGLVDLTASLLNKGTKELTADQFANKTDFIGATVEGASSEDALTVTATGLSKYSTELLGFLRDAALHPEFRQDELDQEKLTTISSLVQKKSDPKDLAGRLRNKLLYGEHPYGAFATPKSVQSITREDLVKFHDTNFLPNNATLIVVGDIDSKETMARVKEAFGDWKSGNVPALQLGPIDMKGKLPRFILPPFPKTEGITVHVVDRPGSVQSNIDVASLGIARDNPDAPELSVVNSVLGGGFSGRLFANLREKHGFTYGAYSGFTQHKLGGVFTATAEVRNAVTGPAVTEIFNELKRITAEPIPDSELALQRQYLAGNFLLTLESNQRIAERLQEIDLYGLPEDFYKTYAKRLVSVTPEKASELAKKYIDPANAIIVIVGEAKEILPQLQGFGKVTVYNTDLKVITEPAKP